jgi:AcrR family transcriptional regulator
MSDSTVIPPPRLRADAVRNRERILEAARKLMAEQGAEVEMADIAREAGVGVGTLYRRFPDKQALITELVREKFTSLRALIEEALDREDLSARQRLDLYIRSACAIQGRDRGLYEAMNTAVAAHAPVARATPGLISSLERLVEEARAEGGVRSDLTWEDVVMCTCALGHVVQIEDDLPGTSERLLEIQLAGLDPRG